MKKLSFFLAVIIFISILNPQLQAEQKQNIVLTAEEYLFKAEAFAFFVDDPTASNGKAVLLAKDNVVGLNAISSKIDYSRLELGKRHTLYGVLKFKISGKNPKAKRQKNKRIPIVITAKTNRDQISSSQIDLSSLDSADSGGWQTFKLLDFILERETIINVEIKDKKIFNEFLIDKLYLTSDYPAHDEKARSDKLKPPYPKQHYRNLFDNFVFSTVYRMKNYFDEDIKSILERQLYDIRMHHIDTVFAAGLLKKSSPQEAEKITRDVLTISDRLGLKAVISLEPFFPEGLMNKFKDTPLITPEVIKKIEQIVEECVSKFKWYNALLGYFLVDEPYPHQLELLTLIQRLIEKQDPFHPVISSIQEPHYVYTFADSQNIIFSGNYPYLKNRKEDIMFVLGNKELVKNIKENIFGGYYWLCVQGFTRSNGVRITRPEYRLQANLEAAGGVEGLVNYTYTPFRYVIADESSSENYIFVNSIEANYSGDYDLWSEVEKLGWRFISLKGILNKLKDTSLKGVNLECDNIFVNLDKRKVIDLTIRELPEAGKVVFLINIDTKKEQNGRINISSDLIKSSKVYDLDRLEEIQLNNGITFDFSLPAGEIAIYIITDSLKFAKLKTQIIFNKLNEKFFTLKLKIQPFLTQGSPFNSLLVELKNIEDSLARSDVDEQAIMNYFTKLSLIENDIDSLIQQDTVLADFLTVLKDTEQKLSEIDAYIKENKFIKKRVSKKRADKFGLEQKMEWQTSEHAEAIDKKFAELAKQYLSIKTQYVRGEWKAYKEKLDMLNNNTDKVHAMLRNK